MRRISRIDRSIDLLQKRATSKSYYICSACHHQANSFSTSSLCAARPKSKPFTERIRSKIWGTDNPPGAEDPYGDSSLFDQSKKRAQLEQIEKKVEKKQAPETKEPEDPSYEPAVTADGLKEVGGFDEWWAKWESENRFKGFLPENRLRDDDDIEKALHRTLVEVFALKQAGIPLAEISRSEPHVDKTEEVRITPSASGADLTFPSSVSLEQVVQSLTRPIEETSSKENPTESEEDVAADRSELDPLEDGSSEVATSEVENYAYLDSAWRDVSLEGPEVKLAVLKRIMQLTGIRVADQALQSVQTADQLLTHLVTPPKARKLVEDLQQNEQLMTTSNVSIHAKRVTPVDKEIAIGRWKVIEEELVKRGLPLPQRR